MKITAVLVVESIEKSLPFWVERIGFEKVAEVPEESHLGFVMLVREGAELMLQTTTSVAHDTPQFAPKAGSNQTALFIEIDDLAEMQRRLGDYPIAMEERQTFYGMKEIGVLEPNGNVVVFGQKT